MAKRELQYARINKRLGSAYTTNARLLVYCLPLYLLYTSAQTLLITKQFDDWYNNKRPFPLQLHLRASIGAKI